MPDVTVLFDEFHREAWSIRPDAAAAMQPTHPQDASYAKAAELLRARRVRAVAGGLDELHGADVLVVAHPSEDRWERTTGVGSPVFTAGELDAIEAFVEGGGGLIVLGEYEHDKYGTNVGDLLARFGIRIEHDTVQDYGRHHAGTPSWVLADLGTGERGAPGDLLAGVADACFYRAGTLSTTAPDAQVLARTSPTASTPGAPLAVAVRHGEGRVVAFADSDLFGDDCIGDLGHEALWCNVVAWAAAPGYAHALEPRSGGAEDDPAWRTLRDRTDALRGLQAPDGALAPGADAEGAAGHVEAMVEAIAALAPRSPHETAYLEAVQDDLRDWDLASRPDFTRSLERFRPERQRTDGIEHLVVFPMYTQNGSRDTRFEALLVRVPWPAWLADLEATRFDNPKFVPVELIDHTAGYDSECAVLFPETVSVAGRPANHFGAIFCDREAERFRRVTTAAADLLGVNLPPDAAALIRSPELSQDAYELWDLIHDRAHSRGDLPFDPFMIRQRMPYWMYSLEELRCDLTAFTEAVGLEREGMAFARHVQYAVLFDRLFRFPVTGSRSRNYDGLGGQLLFAFLHKRGVIRWTDNRLTVDWPALADGVGALRTEVEELYRAGIDRSKLAQWGAAHDLVARFVAPAAGSKWAADVRSYADVEDPRPYIDDVLPDEFPLSMFYVSLKQKLEPVLARPRREAVPA